jgi:hypothetical protein
MVGTPSPQTISTRQLELAQRAERYPHEAVVDAGTLSLIWTGCARRIAGPGKMERQGSTAK